LIQLQPSCSPLSDKQFESDQRQLAREVKQGKKLLKSHAKILLKAATFWKLRYNEKYAEWMENLRLADDNSRLETSLVGPLRGVVTPENGYDNEYRVDLER
jgi:hypothetical protein